MNEFHCGTHLVCGSDALQVLGSLQAERVLLVTDPFFAKNGTADRIAALCKGEVTLFSKVAPDPDLTLVTEGVAQMQARKPDLLIALGGGSAMDCAKGMLSLSGSKALFVAIPTTSGTGSEVTSFAILTHNGTKHPLVDRHLRPQIAVLDDSLLENLPPSLIAEAGMDVLSHCIEAVAARHATPFSNALAISAFRTAVEWLPRSYEGDKTVRSAIHCAATMAGMAFDNAGLGACHALSHALGGMFHLPHGRLNGILLPHVIAWNRDFAPYSLLCSNLPFTLRRLRQRLHLPATLTEAGLKRESVLPQLDNLAKAASADPCSQGNPRPTSEQDYANLLRACL